MSDGVHLCPGCGLTGIPNHLYACGDCWALLPRPLQLDITRTARLTGRNYPGERRAVLYRAASFYARGTETATGVQS